MEQQANDQTQLTDKESVQKKSAHKKSADFYQLLAELTLQQKRLRAVARES